MTTSGNDQHSPAGFGHSSSAAASSSDDDRTARVALTLLTEPGNRTVWSTVQQHGAPATLDLLVAGDLPEITLNDSARAEAGHRDPQRWAAAVLRQAQRLGVRLVVPADAEWPTRIDALATLELDGSAPVSQNMRPPLCLWVRGDWPLAEILDRSVTVAGARAATGYGATVTSDIVSGLVEHGWTIVSGGAFGVDSAAHRAALSGGGRTVAVLACGVDRPYPSGNSAMFERIAETGLLISEWPPGAEPLRHRFLIRNRLMAATTSGTVIVEAALRSGSVQMMGPAIALGRAAMVVPGPVTSAVSAGCHELLRSHPKVRLVTGVPHILEALGHGDAAAEPGQGTPRPDHLDEESALILQAVPASGAATPEDLADRSGLPLRTVLRRIALLEQAGLVCHCDGGVTLSSPTSPVA
jgi:DNA processing protein